MSSAAQDMTIAKKLAGGVLYTRCRTFKAHQHGSAQH